MELARLQPGERVLIHAATGGVGMAAIQIARSRKAEVFATASPNKWPILQAMGIDADHIANSRSVDFEPAFLTATAGAGVDVVLNSLAGEFIDASFRLLPRGGRFIELGKTDPRTPEAVRTAHPGVVYQAFDLADIGADAIQGLLRQWVDGFHTGVLQPLPRSVYDLRQARQAFTRMFKARHIGKLILQTPRRFDPHGPILITGGLGELGLALARHMVTTHGVRHLILTSRRGVDTPGAAEYVADLRARGAETVILHACDIAVRAEVAALLAAHPPRAIFHLAELLDNGILNALTSERLARVLRPKIDGAWHLHQLTQDLELSAFVLFSSVSGVIGTPGQANYATANTFLDALAAERRAQGLPGINLAFDWAHLDNQLQIDNQQQTPWKNWLYKLEWERQVSFSLSPEYMPCVSTLEEQLIAHMDEQDEQLDLSIVRGVEEPLNKWSIAYILAALFRLGLRGRQGARWTTIQLETQLAILPFYRRLLQRMLGILAEAGYVHQEAEQWVVVREFDPIDKVTIANDSQDASLTLLERCGTHLAEVLRGTQAPLELLFPGGDTSLVNQIYRNAPSAQIMNHLVAEVMARIIESLPTTQGIRILEIGAGTGGTTAALLPLLPKTRTKYVYTDIGLGLLNQAQATFADFSFIDYRSLDIEQDPMAQGFAPHQCDFIIAANVLHATKDLVQALAHVQTLLKPTGMLLLLETTQPCAWVDLTFGLTDGWWRFQDLALRPNHPLLTAEQWQTLLKRRGFAATAAVVHPQFGDAIILAQSTMAIPTIQTWAILAPAGRLDLVEALTQSFGTHGGKTIFVFAGTAFHHDGNLFYIDPHKPDDYARLLDTLPTLAGLIHLWSLNEQPPITLDELENVAFSSCATTLYLVQAMLRSRYSALPLWLVTHGAQAVDEQDTCSGFAQAALWGLGRTLALEHPELRPILLDLGEAHSTSEQVPALVAEILSAQAEKQTEGQVALRGAKRYIARLGTCSLAEPAKQPKVTIRADSCYLIVGGSGGLGLLTAEWLVEQGARHLVLMNRTQPTPETQAQLARLSTLGARITTVQADVAKSAEVAAAIAKIEYPLRGIIHSAGIVDDAAFLQMDWQRFRHVLGPKMMGVWNLYQWTKDHDLDFFVLYSSVAGLFGARGQANHAAANTFLDALAHHCRQRHQVGLSIAWGAWSDIGAAAMYINHDRTHFEKQGFGVIAPNQGKALLTHLWSLASSHVAVTPIHWPNLLRHSGINHRFLTSFAVYANDPISRVRTGFAPLSVDAGLTLLDAALGRPEALLVPMHLDTAQLARQESLSPLWASLVSKRRPKRHIDAVSTHALTTLPKVERLTAVRRIVASATAVVLGHSDTGRLDPTTGFTDLGLDSLMAVELRNLLMTETGLTLPATLVLDYPSIERLTRFILQQVAPPSDQTWSDAAIRRKLTKISISAVRESGLLNLLMSQPDDSNDVPDIDVASQNDEDLMNILESELGVSHDF
ncbi:hypothetical protein CCP3SC5AM1_1540002 [Gammaproteobacteria bacterium]